MFKLSEIKELVKLIDQTSVSELEIENEGTRLFIRKPGKTESVVVTHAPAPTYVQAAPQAVPAVDAAAPAAAVSAPAAPAAAPSDAGLHTIKSPMVGTFYKASAPGSAPYVSIGDKVSEKTVVCIVEAMKLMNPIEAEIRGEIVDILVEDGQLVEYNQALFRVKPE
ncbi:acetyl-CoA carboxylase biotin carboxyl carrier protein [Paenibacillus koleovorans]|uniref:acetyl-CoA carboxylase biotin carboxyl carrier protein n=1 Tax=Paenibacillus koleovorans TaxID=121608 RepID=UPI000FDBE733|nr:acetyl-CoA carboxylase biotin carboxyl carrier protein [Paenibacillus koleovorans]